MKEHWRYEVVEKCEFALQGTRKVHGYVSRTETTLGIDSKIRVFWDAKEIVFDRDDYVEHARKIAEMILKICDHPCELPKAEES